jgi:cytoplasmic protein
LNFARVKELPPSQVGSIIGGKVEVNIKANIFQNACAIRLSYAFNYSGMPIINMMVRYHLGKIINGIYTELKI